MKANSLVYIHLPDESEYYFTNNNIDGGSMSSVQCQVTGGVESMTTTTVTTTPAPTTTTAPVDVIDGQSDDGMFLVESTITDYASLTCMEVENRQEYFTVSDRDEYNGQNNNDDDVGLCR
jgi:hypothetical protein